VAFLAGGLAVGGGFFVAGLDSDTVTAPPPAEAPGGAIVTVPPALPAPPPASGQEPVADVARILGPAVVQIETTIGLGSGVIYASEGLILTNSHVVSGTGGEQVTVRLADGTRLPGQVLGADPVVDIAVVRVDPPPDMPVADLALGVPVEVGQLAVAIGSPFELQQTVTAGIVSAVNRPVLNGNGIVAMIQTDAPINPGNSGGALADRFGRVIGINTSIRTETGTNAGIGFAVPIDTAMETARRILAGEPLDQAFLGVAGGDPPGGERGVLVTEVTPGSAAESAGILVGDRIVAIDGEPVVDLLGLAALVRSRRPGSEVTVDLVRDTVSLQFRVELGAQGG
jgi:S1-C subfamily serine protease